ncbi:MAG: GHKL domain-containing protein [Bacilli bacterium]|nr:GHKL domain-containing protein [Bacilli bacterium]
MNVDKKIILIIFLGAFICWLSNLILGKIILKKTKINLKKFNIIFLIIYILFVIIVAIYNLYKNNLKITQTLILNTIIVVGSFFLIFVLIRQYLKNREIINKYKLLEEYLKTSADLIEKYSSTIHKYKNNLITIKGCMNSNLGDANNYIDDLLDNFKTKKYSWFSKINYIKIDSIRYLIYYKLSKAEELNLKISVNVSKNVKNIKNDILNTQEIGILLEILGEYFDNANYASSESKEKELNFILYEENENLVFTIANTYQNKINLSSITKNGYTTKGNGHGFGLYDVEKNVKANLFLKSNYEVDDEYFIVILRVNLNSKNKIDI